MALNVDSLPTEPEQFQSYLDELKDKQLPELEAALVERFTALRASDNIEDVNVDVLTNLGEQIKSTRNEVSKRKTIAAKTAASMAMAQHKQALADLDAIVSGKSDNEPQQPPQPSEAMESLTAAMASAMQTAVTRVQTVNMGDQGNLNSRIRDLSLNSIGKHAPDPKVQQGRKEAVLIASADIPGRAKNGEINGSHDLIELMGARARMMPVTRDNPNFVPVAFMKRDFRYNLSLDSTPKDVNDVLVAATDVGALTAAGGWCAPSEISYDFFNIVCEDGLLDLPTVGVLNRGGFRFPTSPSIADVFGDPEAVWTWTEQEDIEAVTSDSTVKTCARVPCADFNDVRALCDGLCITAGNLTDFAYPEAVENYIQLVMAARAHLTNQSVIQQLVDASTAVDMTGSGEGTTASILNAAEHQAIDYRERYRMCEGAIIEAVFPRWALGAVRADLANRFGMNIMSVTNAMIAGWFDDRAISAQFVADWQSGFQGSPFGDPDTISTDWPATVQFMLYAPGTFVRGQGLQLDLGVVRDSVLNSQNDHTAAWMEDCYVVAQVGHESRLITTDVCTAGPVGAAVLDCAAS